MKQEFNISLRDSQYTSAGKIEPELFDFERYGDYESGLLERNRAFAAAKTGLQVYRRMRGDGVYYDKCKDFKESLAIQLGVLEKSMGYKADIANFLEPWYGIGYIASCFGSDYIWKEGQAPAVEPMFNSVSELLNADFVPIHQSKIGKEILQMIDYFLDKTKGKIPMSFCDIQAPVNMLSYLLPLNNLCLEVFDNMDGVKQAARLVNDLLIDFLKIQQEMIGDCLAKPGHGFASSRAFMGAGESSDNVVMFSDDHYNEIFKSTHEKLGEAFGGVVFHSCGVWSHKAQMIRDFANTITVDAAFSPATDPCPNNPQDFEPIYKGSGITINARCVGDSDSVMPYFEKLINKDTKVIATTYCQDERDQAKLYDRLHEMATK
jgi:hypothetical protein